MIYFANPTTTSIEHMRAGVLGYIDTPGQGNIRPTDIAIWCADNGCFNDARFDENKWWKWLEEHAPHAHNCAFATAPDVVGDAAATLKRSQPWLARIRQLGYKAAFVAQDGIDTINIPWDDFDCLFIGGSTEFKLSPLAIQVAQQARQHGKWVHCGRVNSLRRLRFASEPPPYGLGAHSADGTYLVFGPAKNLPRLLGWLDELSNSPTLFKHGGGAA